MKYPGLLSPIRCQQSILGRFDAGSARLMMTASSKGWTPGSPGLPSRAVLISVGQAYTGAMFESALLLVILLAVGIWIYNRLVQDRNRVLAAWSDIDVQLKRRYDLVPQLVEAVKAYAGYEKATLQAVTELRSRSEAAQHLPEKAAIEQVVEKTVQRLVVVAEDYPDLKADSNFRQLQQELTEVEDHIQYARRYYNGAVRLLNTRIQSFPALLVARSLGFRPAEFFAIDNGEERQAPRAELSP